MQRQSCHFADADDSYYRWAVNRDYSNGIVVYEGPSTADFDRFIESEPIKKDRIKAYNDDDELKFFDIKYKNPVLSKILEKYHYVINDAIDYGTDENYFYFAAEDKVPGYSGVMSMDDLTTTLICELTTIGTAAAGFAEELDERKREITAAFTFISGTSQETSDESLLNTGFDFELKDGVFKVSYRECGGGW